MHSQVVNSDELMDAMRDVGQTFGMDIRPYTATPRAPFESYLSVMARTGVLVSRHGPFLANSIFLPPGEGHSPQIKHISYCLSRTFGAVTSEILSGVPACRQQSLMDWEASLGACRVSSARA